MITRFLSASLLGTLGLLICLAAYPAGAPAELAFQAQLIWGTNGDKPADKPLKEVDAKLQESLKKIFKWKNYYEVKRAAVTTGKDSKKVKLSDKCEIQVQDLGASRVEVRLFGEGNLVTKSTQPLVSGEPIVLGGFSKNDTAWFIVLTPSK